MKNYFELFDIPVSFIVDLNELGTRYRQLQQRVHPDKFVTSSAQERRLSIQYAARVNDAYQVLKSPLTRAQYLFELNAPPGDIDSTLDNSFLIEQIELRETLEGIAGSKNPHVALDAFITEIDRLEKKLINTLTGQFENMTEKMFVPINEAIKKLQFINKLKEETIELEDELP